MKSQWDLYQDSLKQTQTAFIGAADWKILLREYLGHIFFFSLFLYYILDTQQLTDVNYTYIHSWWTMDDFIQCLNMRCSEI